jgi:hypothetical protein
MGTIDALHANGYEANIGLKRKAEDIHDKKGMLENEVAVKWILSF